MGVTWPVTVDELADAQRRVADEADTALAAAPWRPGPRPLVAGCFLAYARGEAGPGHPGDRVWAAAAVWRDGAVVDEVVVADRVPASYAAGYLALREGPALERVVRSLAVAPEVVLVDATGRDHPRRAGLAVHLGEVLDLPTVGVTHRPLRAEGDEPGPARGSTSPVLLDGDEVGRWVRTADGVRPVVAHAGWRTDPATAAEVVLVASTGAARTPEPLQAARRVARTTRAAAGAG